jgi:hypothetical protein
MGDRVLGEAQKDKVSKIIPLRYQQHVTTAGCAVAVTPEPAQLYGLTVLAFLLHTPELHGWCMSCGQDWPCPQVCLAYRIREWF